MTNSISICDMLAYSMPGINVSSDESMIKNDADFKELTLEQWDVWKRISLSKFKVKAVEVMKLFIFLRGRDTCSEPWRAGRSSENTQGLEKPFQAEATVCSKALRWMCGCCSLDRSDGWAGRTGSLHQGWELRLYLTGVPKPLELDMMPVSFFWAV